MLCAIILSITTSKAQVLLDTIYQDARAKLYMVNLEISGMKYVLRGEVQGNRFLKFYNLDHSLWKTIDVNPFPVTLFPPGANPLPTYNYNYESIYISETLFDCDNDIEFMYVSNSNYRWFTGIYKENGTALLMGDSLLPMVRPNVPQQFRPIYNTPGKTKLILSHMNGTARVYDLQCSLSTGVDQNRVVSETDPPELNVFPNPSFYESQITYKLPIGVTSGEIVMYDLNGKLIRNYAVDNSFSSILIQQNEMAAGTYLYVLKANGQVIDSKKIILSK